MMNTTPWRPATAERTDWRAQAACRRLDLDGPKRVVAGLRRQVGDWVNAGDCP